MIQRYLTDLDMIINKRKKELSDIQRSNHITIHNLTLNESVEIERHNKKTRSSYDEVNGSVSIVENEQLQQNGVIHSIADDTLAS